MTLKPSQIIVFLLALAMLVCPWKAEPAMGDSVQIVSARAGVVTRLEGEVRLQRHGETEIRPLKIGEQLSAGNVVLTGAEGRAEFTLHPDSYLQVGPQSRLRIYEMGSERMHFDIERGEVFVIIMRFEQGAALVLDTPPAILNVTNRGYYRVRVASDNVTEAAVKDGELQFVNAAGKTVKIRTRKRVRFKAAQRRKVWDTAMTTDRH